MSAWEQYPVDYRSAQVQEIWRAARSGECVSVVGLSGSGKSNLLGFVANRFLDTPAAGRIAEDSPLGLNFILIDCNRLEDATPQAFFRLARRGLEGPAFAPAPDDLLALEAALAAKLAGGARLCLLLDRFDALTGLPSFGNLAGNLRALRDAYKYSLSYVTATRRPLDAANELSELFFGRTMWLGPMSRSDALWSAQRDMRRLAEAAWSKAELDTLVDLSWGYPSLLRAACEAFAGGAPLTVAGLRSHPAVLRRAAEFWADRPGEDELRQSGLAGQPLLGERADETGPVERKPVRFDTAGLTAKENLLLEHLLAHAGEVCEKDDLVQAIWPEDVIFEQGIRDESLAQLVRRLRVKIEPDPGAPEYLHTVPGRGYIFKF